MVDCGGYGMEPVAFDVKITQNDYLKFNYWVSTVRQSRLILTLIVGVLILGLLGVGIWLFVQTGLLLTLIIIILLPALLALQFFSGYRRVKKSYAGSATLREPIHYTIQNEMISMEGTQGEGEYETGMVHKAYITKNYLFVGLRTGKFLIIPRRCIPEGKEEAVLGMVNAMAVKA